MLSVSRVRREGLGVTLSEQRLPWSVGLDEAPSDVDREDLVQLARGRLRLLNLTQSVGVPIAWRSLSSRSLPPLWLFHLHYHDFLRPWVSMRGAEGVINDVIDSWLDEYGDGGRGGSSADPIAWHPYVISRRVFAWSLILAAGDVGKARSERMGRSLAAQVDWLDRHLERDIGGNHLWMNGQALALAGILFAGRGAGRWWERGKSLLDTAIEEQLSVFGEHFERSPMYQLELARGLEELAAWAEHEHPSSADSWRASAARMKGFVEELRHPDGTVCLFGDSTTDEAGMRQVEGKVADRSDWVGDYFVHRRASDLLVFDAGDVAADSLPAHGHSDLLGFELSLNGERIFADRGVFAYTGVARGEYRSSGSHNVLTIDGMELADTWSSFRMGRRGHVVNRSSVRTSDGLWIMAGHDAYRQIGIPRVDRYWFLSDLGPWFCFDVMRPRGVRRGLEKDVGDLAKGVSSGEKRGRLRCRWHRAMSRLWLAEDRRVRQEEHGWRVIGERSSCTWMPMASMAELPAKSRIEPKVTMVESTRSSRFYRTQPCVVISMENEFCGVSTMGWMISKSSADCGPVLMRSEDGWRIEWRSARGIESAWTPDRRGGFAAS
jgi:hypothetical protein